ncbi:MAG TPA: hypothetical protein VGO47_11735 [Chlamydiales bacterium]|nr:hypothetical protein [Chlamydiales bacterium]
MTLPPPLTFELINDHSKRILKSKDFILLLFYLHLYLAFQQRDMMVREMGWSLISSNSSNTTPPSTSSLPYYYPFNNSSTFQLMHWFYSGSAVKTLAELNSLVQYCPPSQ